MSGLNNGKNNGVKPMEMESLQPMPVQTSTGPPTRLIDSLWLLIKLYMEYYPKTTAVILFAIIGVLMSIILPDLRNPVTRNRLNHDYTHISTVYDVKASKMDHWCLWGGDHNCQCLDFSEPETREYVPGWTAAHEANKKRVKAAASSVEHLDVLFLGDGMVEMLNGQMFGKDHPNGMPIAQLFKKDFTREGGGEFDSVAVGIEGDQSANLLWRIQHEEIPDSPNVNIYWLWNGINDLIIGFCSEEAIVLGILRVAEELVWNDPDAVVVVQGLLPVSRHDGLLEDSVATGLFHHQGVPHSVDQAKKKFPLWPSIQAVNKELELFCTNHSKMVYYDPTDLFVGSVGNSHFSGSSKRIIGELMPDYLHPNFAGYKVLLASIKRELERILWDDDEKNDVEKKDGTVDGATTP